MHRSLRIPEILDTVMDYVEWLPHVTPAGDIMPFYEGSHHLAILARTCRTFMEPALNVLWRRQQSLYPLVRTLPEDAWHEITTREEEVKLVRRLSFTRQLNASDWNRFQMYAKRIKRMGFLQWEHREQELENMHSYGLQRQPPFDFLDEGVYAELALHGRSRTLLPNLREIRWCIFDLDLLPHVSAVFGPALTSIQLSLAQNYSPVHSCDEDSIVSTMSTLLKKQPPLRGLEMSSTTSSRIVDAIKGLAYAVPTMETFLVHEQAWEEDFIGHLSCMPNLRKVGLRLETRTDFKFLSRSSHDPPFMSLRVLALTVQTLQCATNLIERMGSCRLTNLSVAFTESPTVVDLHDFFKALRDNCAHSTLRVIRLSPYANPNSILITDEYVMTFKTLEPLLCFPNLQVAVMSCLDLCARFDNADLSKMAQAWPSLITLTLPNSLAQRPGITYQGLLNLSRQCPYLDRLDIAFDASVLDIDLDTAASLPLNRCLYSLHILDSWLGDPDFLVKGILAIFPEVWSIQGYMQTWPKHKGELLDYADRFTYFTELQTRLEVLREAKRPQLKAFNDEQRRLRGDFDYNEFNPWLAP